MNLLPCVVFAFNRPKKLISVLDALKKQDVDRLIVFVDGERDKADLEKVDSCRELARKVDWVDTELYLWAENRGLRGISDNISLVFEKHSWAVFVEDDCLPMPGFYALLRSALEHYQAMDQVFSIGGYQPIENRYFKPYPYDVVGCARFLCWGWATWQDRWKRVEPYLKQYGDLFDHLQKVPKIGGVDLEKMAQDMAAGKTKESWDVKVSIASLWLNLTHLIFTWGLVRNIGLDRSGVHGGFLSMFAEKIFYNRNVSQSLPKEPSWVEDVNINLDYMNKLNQWIRKRQNFSLLWKQIRRLK